MSWKPSIVLLKCALDGLKTEEGHDKKRKKKKNIIEKRKRQENEVEKL